ncbi:hypothetical protein BGX28_000253, partial [Mortierella sp. GBA30]
WHQSFLGFLYRTVIYKVDTAEFDNRLRPVPTVEQLQKHAQFARHFEAIDAPDEYLGIDGFNRLKSAIFRFRCQPVRNWEQCHQLVKRNIGTIERVEIQISKPRLDGCAWEEIGKFLRLHVLKVCEYNNFEETSMSWTPPDFFKLFGQLSELHLHYIRTFPWNAEDIDTLDYKLENMKIVDIVTFYSQQQTIDEEILALISQCPNLRSLTWKWDEEGWDQEESDQEALDQEELDQEELDPEELDQEELDQEELDPEELDQEVSDQEGLDQEVSDQEGLDQEVSDQEAFDQEESEEEESDQEYGYTGRMSKAFRTKALSRFTQEYWPHLQALVLDNYFQFSDSHIATILKSRTGMDTLGLSPRVHFADQSFAALQSGQYLETLKVLELPRGATSPQVLQILSSAPKLEHFTASTIFVDDVEHSAQWVCTGLKSFKVGIKVKAPHVPRYLTSPKHQDVLESTTKPSRHLMKALSGLRQLEVLDMRTRARDRHEAFKFDLTLPEEDLRLLSELKHLSQVCVISAKIDDVELAQWMINQWPKLHCFHIERRGCPTGSTEDEWMIHNMIKEQGACIER